MTAPAIPAPAKGRLGNGQLRRQVAEWLAARPGPHTVGEIAKDLGRSAGAVGKARGRTVINSGAVSDGMC